MTPRAFVTGASGFVGSHVVRVLHQQGWEVHVLARPTSSLGEIEGIPYHLHEGDVTELGSLEAAIPEGAEAVFHVAASVNFWSRGNDAQTRVNVDGTRNMILAAAGAGVGRFIHTSSFVTWGFPGKEVNEDSPRSDAEDCEQLRVVTVAPLLAEAIRRINNEESVSSLFV